MGFEGLFPVARFGAEDSLLVIQETELGMLSCVERFWMEVCLLGVQGAVFVVFFQVVCCEALGCVLRVQEAGPGHAFSCGAFLGRRLPSWSLGAAFRVLFPVACFFSRECCLLRVWWAGVGALFHVTHSGAECAFLRFLGGCICCTFFCVVGYGAGGCLLGAWRGAGFGIFFPVRSFVGVAFSGFRRLGLAHLFAWHVLGVRMPFWDWGGWVWHFFCVAHFGGSWSIFFMVLFGEGDCCLGV